MHDEYEYNDRKYECEMDDFREREIISRLSNICYDHGLKLGIVIQSTLENIESTLGKLRPIDYLAIAEGITESCWDVLNDEIGSIFPDYDEVENGICDSSSLYLHAKRMHEASKKETQI